MTLPSWPATVRKFPILDGYREPQQHSPNYKTEFEYGAQRSRRTSTVRRRTVSARWLMTETEFETFETFYNETLQQGNLSFILPFYRNGVLTDKVCKFVEEYKPVPNGVGWSVDIVIYVYD